MDMGGLGNLSFSEWAPSPSASMRGSPIQNDATSAEDLSAIALQLRTILLKHVVPSCKGADEARGQSDEADGPEPRIAISGHKLKKKKASKITKVAVEDKLENSTGSETTPKHDNRGGSFGSNKTIPAPTGGPLSPLASDPDTLLSPKGKNPSLALPPLVSKSFPENSPRASQESPLSQRSDANSNAK